MDKFTGPEMDLLGIIRKSALSDAWNDYDFETVYERFAGNNTSISKTFGQPVMPLITSVLLKLGVDPLNDYNMRENKHELHRIYVEMYKGLNIVSMDIPNSVVLIDQRAFEKCNSLRDVTIPDSVQGIGAYAFKDCDRLESISIGNGVASLCEYAFQNCRSLISIDLSNCKLVYFGDGVFKGCTLLQTLILPTNAMIIGPNILTKKVKNIQFKDTMKQFDDIFKINWSSVPQIVHCTDGDVNYTP